MINICCFSWPIFCWKQVLNPAYNWWWGKLFYGKRTHFRLYASPKAKCTRPDFCGSARYMYLIWCVKFPPWNTVCYPHNRIWSWRSGHHNIKIYNNNTIQRLWNPPIVHLLIWKLFSFQISQAQTSWIKPSFMAVYE